MKKINTLPGGWITVDTSVYEMFVWLDVCDNGTGIPESEHAKLFERFWRSPTVRDAEGTGIGLYLVREIVAMQGGYVKVKSTLGEGSVFSIFLPKE